MTSFQHTTVRMRTRRRRLTALTDLAEADLAVAVLVHLGDHRLEAEVRLRRAELLHHQLQLRQVNKLVLAYVIPGDKTRCNTL